MYQNILVPTDGSEELNNIIKDALDIGKKFNSTIHIIYVARPVYGEFKANELIKGLKKEGEKILEDIKKITKSQKIDVKTEIREGTIHKEILNYTEKNNIDLIIMGTHRYQGIEKYLTTNITSRVVRLSNVPVIVMPIN